MNTVEPPGQPKFKQLCDRLAAEIRNGVFPAGAFLPSETELMARFDVSRNTVRKAIAELRREKLVTTSQGCKSRVEMPKPTTRRHELKAGWLDYNSLGAGEPVYFEIFTAAAKYAEDNGISLQYINARNETDLRRYLDTTDKTVGTIATGITRKMLSPENFELCRQLKNLITIDDVEGSPAQIAIATDNYAGAQTAVFHLVSAGIEHIAFLGACPVFSSYHPFNERLRGYRDALAAVLRYEAISEDANDFFNVHPLVEKLLRKHPEIKAIFAATDYIAIQTIYALKTMGYNVPHDISVIGFDGIAMGAHTSPGLTTVAHPCDEIGKQAVLTLTELYQEKFIGPPKRWIAPSLILRESTRCH